MVGPIRDPKGGRRRNRVYGAHESAGARSSELSLVSNTTGVSTTSTDSMSTVTQDTYSRSRRMSESRKQARRRSNEEERGEMLSLDNIVNRKDINVFEFLVEEEVVEASEPEEVAQSEDISPRREVAQLEDVPEQEDISLPEETPQLEESTQPEMEMTNSNSALTLQQDQPMRTAESDLEGYYRSQLSDSGISMGSSISEPHLDMFTKHSLPPLIEEANDYSVYAPSVVDPYFQHDYPIWNPYIAPLYTPEPVPLSPASIRSYPYPQEYRYQGTPEPPSTGESSTACLDSAPLVFRHKGSNETPHPQIFRSFARVNARLLMQMQSNIADLEHELSTLDSKIAIAERSARSKKGDHNNLSRHLTKDQTRRADLYQELNISLLEYYDAIESFHKVSQITSPARSRDTAALKTWLRAHVVPSSKIGPLLGDGSDLVQLGHRQDEISNKTLRLVAYCVFTNMLFPLILFKLTSSVLSRLILLSITGTVTALVLDRHRTTLGLELGQTFGFCTLACLGISLLAALLF